MQKVLVTGAAGFIGFHTAIRLLKLGYEVIGIDNLNEYYSQALKRLRLEQFDSPAFSFREMDICQSADIMKLFAEEQFDYVINLAAQPGARYSVENPDTYIETNIRGFLNILEACRHHKPEHLVYASSSSIYGNNTKMPFAESDMTDIPASLYGASKKTNELMAYSYSHLYGIPATGLRFFTVYGPWGRPDMAYFKYTEAILKAEPIDVYNQGELRRDFTFIDDIVKGITDLLVLLPDDDVPHLVFNIGNSTPVGLIHFIEVLENILGKKAIKNMLPMQQGDVIETYADTSLLEKHCGYKPYTELEVGLKKFVDWYFNIYKKSI